MKKIIIFVLAFISFRCGGEIPGGVVDTVNENLHVKSLTTPVDSAFYNPKKPLYISIMVNKPQLLKAAYFNLESSDGFTVFSNQALLDIKDTLTADDSTGDGIYSGRINLDSSHAYGLYKLSIYIEDFNSQIIKGSANSFIFDNGKGNNPPIISDVIAPSTIKKPTGSQVASFVVSVKVSDPEGLDDIRRVYFNSYGPEFPTFGIPLWDDGDNGDEVAHDGVYSRGLSIESDNLSGEYRFEFVAEDKRRAESNIIDHIITVTE